MPVDFEFVSNDVLRIGTTRFRFDAPLTYAPPGHLGIDKTSELLQSYIGLWDDLGPRRVVEIGIHLGGSTAMLCELGVERLVSVELSDVRVEALDRYIAERGVHDVVHPWYGVNQADRGRLAQIVTDEFGAEPLDLVVDDASHLYDESVASFEVLFPRLRPGGIYLLEDWRWNHILAERLAMALRTSDAVQREAIQQHIRAQGTPHTPMSRLVMELVLARAIKGDVVEEIVVGPDWTAVRRGPAELDPDTFRLAEHAADHFQMLSPRR